MAVNDKNADARRQLAQCYLLENNHVFAAMREHLDKASSKSRNYFTFRGTSRKLRAKFISVSGIGGLFSKIESHQLYSLIPDLRIRRVDSKDRRDEYVFTNYLLDVADITRDKAGRGHGVGLKSFSYEMTGGTPATASSVIEAELVLQFNSLTDVMETRNGVSFADLLTQPKKFTQGNKCDSPSDKQVSSSYYKIQIELGYSIPEASNIFTKAQKEELKEAKRVFELSLVQHSVTFKDDGSVEISFEYMAYVDQLFANADVLSLGMKHGRGEALQKMKKEACLAQEKVNKAQGTNCGPDGEPPESEELDAANEELEKAKTNLEGAKGLIYGALIDKLFEHNNVYVINVPASDMESGSALNGIDSNQIRKDTESAEESKKAMRNASKALTDKGGYGRDTGKEDNLEGVNNEMGGTPGVADATNVTGSRFTGSSTGSNAAGGTGATSIWTPLASKVKAVTDPIGNAIMNNQSIELKYFYFGDLLNAALESLHDEPSAKKMKIIVGTVKMYYKFGDGDWDASHIPIENIPISLPLFNAWWIRNVIHKERESYPLKAFIMDVLNNLVKPALTPSTYCYEGRATPYPARFSMDAFSLPKVNGSCQVTGTGVGVLGSKGKFVEWETNITKRALSGDKADEFVYFYLYGTTSEGSTRYKGELGADQQRQDEANGIYHLKPGSNKGIVKKVSFKKSDQAGVKEARLEAGGATDLTDLYNADVELFGTSVFKPGMTVFIDPTSVVPSSTDYNRSLRAAFRLGLGGYYIITKVTTSLEPGSYKTDLTCVWESAPVQRTTNPGVNLGGCNGAGGG